jgi:hypothetical protein
MTTPAGGAERAGTDAAAALLEKISSSNKADIRMGRRLLIRVGEK